MMWREERITSGNLEATYELGGHLALEKNVPKIEDMPFNSCWSGLRHGTGVRILVVLKNPRLRRPTRTSSCFLSSFDYKYIF